MKLPSTVFVLHCPKLSPERKEFLQGHLENRVPIKDVRWIEDYNHDHVFVEWLNHVYKLPYGVKMTSGMVKSLKIFETMITEDIESSIILNDDVMFHKDWLHIFDSINCEPTPMFINLGTALFLDIKPEIGKLYKIPNNGGCEGIYVTKQFCQLFLESLNMNHAFDIVFHGFLYSINHPVLCLPVCYQTSNIEKNTCLDHDTRKTENQHWSVFVKNYKSGIVNYFDILEKFKKYIEMKKYKEKQILELYDKVVDIRNVDYVYANTPDFCNSIIKNKE